MLIAAKYTYGKPVKGYATVTFGLMWHGHVFTVGKQRNLMLNDTGYTECKIDVNELRLPVESVWFPVGGKLHIHAVVTETASGRSERADDVSVVFSDHLYVIKFTKSSRFFKPGLPYVSEIEIFKPNGEHGSNLELTVLCKAEIKPGTEPILLSPTSVAQGNTRTNLTTNSLGKLTVEYLVPKQAKLLSFHVAPSTESMEGPALSTYYFYVTPFFSPLNVFMHLRVVISKKHKEDTMAKVGDHVTATAEYTSPELVKTVNLVVLSKGKIVWQTQTRNLRGNYTSFYFELTQAMSPGIRVVAFSAIEQGIESEVVSDSVSLDIFPQCNGELKIEYLEHHKHVLRPGDIGTISLTGEPHSLAGLVAVDKAVLHLRNGTLTRNKLFDSIKSHDRGCGSGGGSNTHKVFENSGLMVITSAKLEMLTKLSEGCVDKTVRKRRSPNARKRIGDLCCLEGTKVKNGTLALCYYIAQQLKKYVKGPGLCFENFFTCCRDVIKGTLSLDAKGRVLSQKYKEEPGLDLDFQADEQDDLEMTFTDIPLRTNFPESWWFEEYNLGPEGKANIDFVLPDSITSWSIHALGVSREAGLCIAPPLEIATFSSFFVNLDLPYSVVRLEQFEVRATVYNYMSRKLRVRLMLQSVDGVCYSSEPGKATEIIRLEVEPNDAASAYFPIIPLEIGDFPIQVMAFSAWGRDAVERTLRVVGEGIEKVHTVSVMLDPSGKRFIHSRHTNHSFFLKNEVKVAEKRQSVELDLDLPQEVIPDTEDCTVHAMGDLLGPTLQVIVEGVTELLRLPTGCGEQNLIYLAPNVYVTRYLRATRRLSSQAEKKSRTLIRQGVARQMTFRKPDGSYGTWPHADSSTWLTAFAMKTLCQAGHYVTIDHNQTCSSMEWIAAQQFDNGSFSEEAWVTHREMLGGINADVSHTAFILTALLECSCPFGNQSSMRDAALRYIEEESANTDRPLAVAISAYALTLAGSPKANSMTDVLLQLARSDSEGYTYWGPGAEKHFTSDTKPYWYTKKPGALAVEVTSYALLTFLARGDLKMSTSIVGWLLQQRNSHGAFISTQDTVVGLQALSEYSIKSYSAILDMTCHIRSEVDTRFRKSISLTPEDAMVLKSVPKVPTGGKLHFEAEGTGVGLMQVDVRYNVPEDPDECRFEVKVNTFQHNTLLQSFFWGNEKRKCEPCSVTCEEDKPDEDDYDDEDYEDFEFPPIVPRIQVYWRDQARQEGLSYEEFVKLQEQKEIEEKRRREKENNQGLHSLLSKIGRPKRALPSFSATVLCVEVCVRFLGNKTTGMTVADVGLFTGYLPVEDDLKQLKLSGKIDYYEKSQRSVVLYIDQVSNSEVKCFKFRARQEHTANNIQPARVQLFDYYNPSDKCTVFYKHDNRSGQLANFCDHQKQICQCLESRCASCEERWQGLRWMDLIKYSCTNASYVLQVKVLDRNLEKASFERLLGQVVEISLQKGQHQLKENDKVILLKRSSCFCPRLTPGKTYFMMLSPPKRFKDADGNTIFAFLLDKKVFAVEHFKNKQKGLTRAQRSTARNVRRAERRLKRRGCRRGSKVKARGQRKRNARNKQNAKKKILD